MNRLFIIYNPRSSRFSDVKNEILEHQKDIKGYIVGKYKIEPTNFDKNVSKLAKILKDGDFIISAGGDATSAIVVNAILKSKKDIRLAALPYGNFNDLSHTLGTNNLESALSGSTQKFYPLEIIVDGQLFRYATCYATIGMMAEAVHLYDSPKMRKALKTAKGRKIGSYTNLAKWYFKNRHKKIFMPEFKLNGKAQPKKTSDYAAINGKYMARIMKGGEDFKKPNEFRSETDRLTNLWRLFKLMTKSIFCRIPGSETKGDVLEFLEPATVELQAEGEYETFKNIKKIEIRKSEKCLKTVTK